MYVPVHGYIHIQVHTSTLVSSSFLSICPSIYLSIYICLCIHLSIYLPIYLSIYLSVSYLSIHLSMCLSVRLSTCLAACQSINLSVCRPAHPFMSIFACLSVYLLLNSLPIYLSIYPCIHPSIHVCRRSETLGQNLATHHAKKTLSPTVGTFKILHTTSSKPSPATVGRPPNDSKEDPIHNSKDGSCYCIAPITGCLPEGLGACSWIASEKLLSFRHKLVVELPGAEHQSIDLPPWDSQPSLSLLVHPKWSLVEAQMKLYSRRT